MVLFRRLCQYIYRLNVSLYDFFSHFKNLFDTLIQIITFLTIALWIQITFSNSFVEKINSGVMASKTVNAEFDNFDNISTSLSNFQHFQAILMYLTTSKLLIFFFMPKRTYMILEMLSLAATYISFFMVLYILVNFVKIK